MSNTRARSATDDREKIVRTLSLTLTVGVSPANMRVNNGHLGRVCGTGTTSTGNNVNWELMALNDLSGCCPKRSSPPVTVFREVIAGEFEGRNAADHCAIGGIFDARQEPLERRPYPRGFSVCHACRGLAERQDSPSTDYHKTACVAKVRIGGYV